MNKIDIHVLGGGSIVFTGVYRRDLQTDTQHFYETIDGEIKSFDKDYIRYVIDYDKSTIDLLRDEISDHLFTRIGTHPGDIKFACSGMKHPTMKADNWIYIILEGQKVMHLNRRYFAE